MIDLIVLASLIALGYFAGSYAERRHYRSIREREERFLTLPAVSFRSLTEPERAERARLVAGSAVISVDYFKRVLAGLRSIVGGRIKSYESLLDRARREALLRSLCPSSSGSYRWRQKIETTSISKGSMNRNQSVSTVEALAYGTAVYYRK